MELLERNSRVRGVMKITPFFSTILNEFFISLSVKLEKFIIDTVSFYLVKILNYVLKLLLEF